MRLRRRRFGLTPLSAALAGAALASGACGASGPPDEALEAVVQEAMNSEVWVGQGVEVSDVEVFQTSRWVSETEDDEGETWCVAVDAVASDPRHWMHGRSIWLASENEDGSWATSPTFIIAVKDTRSWYERCGMEEPTPS